MKTPLASINSIETSSLCDNSCVYCPCKDQGQHRKTGLMDLDTFEKALEFVMYCGRRGSQRELNLFGVGEPTLNPMLVDMVEMARAVLPLSQPLHINTNGNRLTEDLCRALKAAGIDHIDITYHIDNDPKKTAEAIEMTRRLGLRGNVSIDPVVHPNNWAGQVEFIKPTYTYPCPWLHNGQVMIMSNGDITTCCFDAFGAGIVGNVFDSKPEEIELETFSLCAGCHQTPPAFMG